MEQAYWHEEPGPEIEDNMSADVALTCHEEAISAGYGIVDCGATVSLVSVDAMEAIMRANMNQC